VACAVIAAVVLVLGDAFIWHGGLNTAASAASVIAIIFVFPTVLRWARKTSRPAIDSTPQQVAEAAQYLAGKVREQWLTEIGIRRLHDPDPVAVKWRLTDRAVGDMSPNVAAHRRLRFAGSADHVAKLAEAFRTLDRRRLVIIGEPGMGKTTLAALLLVHLLEPVEPADRWPSQCCSRFLPLIPAPDTTSSSRGWSVGLARTTQGCAPSFTGRTRPLPWSASG
jgi:hypothetical protein